MKIDAEEIAVSLTYARADVTKTYRQGMPSQRGPAPTAKPESDGTPAQSSSDTTSTEPHPF